MADLIEEKGEKIEVDYSKVGTWMEKPPESMRTDLKKRKEDFFDLFAERATEVLKQFFQWVWPLILLGFFSTLTLVGALIFAEGLATAPINIVLAWVLLFAGGVAVLLCGFCSVCLLIVELARFYIYFAFYIRTLKARYF